MTGPRRKKATEIHQKLLPVYTGMFRTQGVMTTKAALALMGLPGGPLRPPMIELTPEEIEQLKAGDLHTPTGAKRQRVRDYSSDEGEQPPPTATSAGGGGSELGTLDPPLGSAWEPDALDA